MTNYKAIIQILTDTTALDKKAELLQGEYTVVTELLKKCVEDNAHQAQDQVEYQKRYSGLVERYDNVKREISEVEETRLERCAKREKIAAFLRTLEERESLISEFDENLWLGTVESVTINSTHEVVFTFKDGLSLDWPL